MRTSRADVVKPIRISGPADAAVTGEEAGGAMGSDLVPRTSGGGVRGVGVFSLALGGGAGCAGFEAGALTVLVGAGTLALCPHADQNNAANAHSSSPASVPALL